MKNNTTKFMYPFILVGTGLNEIYVHLDTGLKKVASLTAGIEDSNMRASLNSQRNISKNTLRKLATGLEVYPIIFFISSKNIKSERLEYQAEEGIAYIANFDDFLELIYFAEDTDAEQLSFNDDILSALDNLFDKIQLAKSNKLNRTGFKRKIYHSIIDLISSVSE